MRHTRSRASRCRPTLLERPYVSNLIFGMKAEYLQSVPLIYETEFGHGFSMRGEGEGRTEVTMVLTQEVTDKTLRGEYRCKNVTVYDTYYNHKTFAPNIRFRIENVPGDHEGRSS